MLIDLQLHSIYSDGYLTPTQLANFIAKQGVKIAAITDHNTISGFNEFSQACRKNKIKPILGLELYVKFGAKKLNVLWYNFDKTSPELQALIHETQLRRRTQVRRHLNKLVKLGFSLPVEKILDKYNHYIPVNKIIDDFLSNKKNIALVKKQLKETKPREEEIIKNYFFNKKTGRLLESYVNFSRIIKLKKKIGGSLILAHPGKYNQLKPNLLEKLKLAGLDGIEVMSAHHNLGATMYAQFLVNKYKFIASGGSDFHRFEGQDRKLQTCYNYFKIDSNYLPRIEKIIQ